MRRLLVAAFCSSLGLLVSGCGGGSGGGSGGTGSNASPPNPVPAISSLSPSSATAAGAAFSLTVNGTNFLSTSQVQWNGNDRTTTYVSATQLSASISASDIATGGTASVTVVNPAPGGGPSAAVAFATNNPMPTIGSLAPASGLLGSPFNLTVNGTNFVSSSQVQWNGSSRVTTFVSATQLTAQILAADVATAGPAKVTVVNAAPGGGTSASAPLLVATVLADASNPGPAMGADQLGVNLNIGFTDDTNSAFLPLYKSAGIKLFRWPGGALADYYHWQSNTYSTCSPYANPPASNSFDNWMTSTPVAMSADVAITVNYANNPTCTGTADPNEAAAWVNYANNTQHYGVKYWTVGNEQYYYNGTTASAYATAVATQFYPLMKAQDATIQVGVDVEFGNGIYDVSQDAWDPVVLANAKYDFVEMHYYPEGNNQNSDTAVLSKWSDQVATNFSTMKSLLATAGKPNTPIFLGEFDRDYGDNGTPGHQSVSVVNALFTAIVVGEATKAGVTLVATWTGLDYCWPDVSPPSTAYGWQTWGSWGLFAATGSGFSESCADKGVPGLTPLPKGSAYQILSQYVVSGATVVNIQSGDSSVRAYAAKNGANYSVMLINTDENATHTPVVSISNAPTSSYSGATLVYGKAQYDLSQTNQWVGPVSGSLGSVSLSNFSVALPPWSITLVTLTPGS